MGEGGVTMKKFFEKCLKSYENIGVVGFYSMMFDVNRF